MHSVVEFIMKHPDKSKIWYENSNSIIFLSVANELELLELINKCKEKEIEYCEFREPDLDNSLTSICIEPSKKTKRLCYNLKLALK
jgi:hypothetical protein